MTRSRCLRREQAQKRSSRARKPTMTMKKEDQNDARFFSFLFPDLFSTPLSLPTKKKKKKKTALSRSPQTNTTMGKVPVRLREVVYTLSPFQQTVMGGLFKDIPARLTRKVSENWFDVSVFFLLPTWATMAYAADYKEKEKQGHRF